MSTLTETAGAVGPPNRSRVIAVALLVVGAVLVNLIAQAYMESDPLDDYAVLGDFRPTIVAAAGGDLLIGTMDNELFRLDAAASSDPTSVARFDNVIHQIVVDDQGHTVFVACADRSLYELAGDLAVLSSRSFNGRVVGAAVGADGGVAVAYGIGAYSNKYYVERLAPDGSVVFKHRANFTIRGLTADRERFYYVTADAHAVGLDGAGEVLWDITLDKNATVLSPVPTGGFLAGDEGGGLHLLQPDGTVAWSVSLSQFPVTALHLQRGTVYAADEHGTLFTLGLSGSLRNQRSVHEEEITGIVPHRDQIAVIDFRANAVLMPPDGLSVDQRNRVVSTVRTSATTVLLLSALIVGLSAVERIRYGARSLRKRIWRYRLAYFLIVPSLALMGVFVYYPTITAFVYSFTDFNLMKPPEFVGLANFRKLLDDFYFWIGMGNLAKILVTQFAKALTTSLIAAELVFWLTRKRHKYLFRTLFVIPSIVPKVILVLIWKMMYDPYSGLINNLLVLVGLESWQHAWLGEADYAMWSIIFAGFPWITAFPFLVYMGGLINIDKDIFDAADIDGVSGMQRFFRIDLPLIRPQIRIILFFAYLGAIQMYSSIWVYTRGGPGHATYVPALQMYYQISNGANLGYASAIGLVLFFIVLVGTLSRFRFGKTATD